MKDIVRLDAFRFQFPNGEWKNGARQRAGKGWLVFFGLSMTYVHDPDYEWDGNNLSGNTRPLNEVAGDEV